MDNGIVRTALDTGSGVHSYQTRPRG